MSKCTYNYYIIIIDKETGIAPIFDKPIKISYSEEASEAEIICNIAGHPTPIVQCFKENIPLESMENSELCYNNSTGEVLLKLKNLQSTNTDTILNYTIQAENEYGRAVGKAQLVIQAAKIKETVFELQAPYVSPLKPQLLVPGSTLEFSSSYYGIEEPEIKWYRNGKEITTDEDISILTTNGVSTLTVRNMTRQKAGKYEILAMNQVGESRTSASVTISTDEIYDNLTPPYFKKPLYPKTVIVNDVVILEVQVESNPISSFQWFQNSVPVKVSDITRISSKENKSILIMKCIVSENAGVYTCRAENVLGSVTSTVDVKVIDNDNELGKVNEYISPRFIEKLKPAQLMDGDTLALTCRVIGYPISRIDWMHNQELINEAKGIEIIQDSDGLCTLRISEVFPEDAGDYICYAINSIGKAQTKTNVIVEGIFCVIYFCVWYEKFMRHQLNTIISIYLYKCLLSNELSPI